MKRFKVGVLGCGDVSDIYIENCKTFPLLEIAACASLHPEKARKKRPNTQFPGPAGGMRAGHFPGGQTAEQLPQAGSPAGGLPGQRG